MNGTFPDTVAARMPNAERFEPGGSEPADSFPAGKPQGKPALYFFNQNILVKSSKSPMIRNAIF